RALNEASVVEAARRLVAEGVRTAAIALMHSYRNPVHERRVAEILRAVGFTHVSMSSDLATFIKLLPRAQTAVVNAYLSPIMDAYLRGIEAEFPSEGVGATLHVMTSAGGLVRSREFHAKDSLLSGPAGGVVGALHAGVAAGWERIIAFDMGGTSTDVARCDGGFDYVWEHSIGDAHLVAPALAIESVAAGGGSICRADRHGLRVGPESAGADPGPACYGAGGPLTITDVNLLLGRIVAERFEIPLDFAAAERAADNLLADLFRITGVAHERESVLNGLLDIANERMADAIRRISLRRGYDPAEYALVAFGGAGDQHACAVAARLGMRTVILPTDASLLSAWGLGHAAIERFTEQQILRPLSGEWERSLPSLLEQMAQKATDSLSEEGVAGSAVRVLRRIVTMRLAGQETGLEIEYTPGTELADLFAARYAAIYGYLPATDRTIEVEAVRVVVGASNGVSDWSDRNPDEDTARVESGWMATSHASGATILTATEATPTVGRDSPEAVRETLFAGRFTAIAEEMGEMLRRTALSTNVKERLDFSCALLDPEGRLVANAAHIPVHLGALGECVRRVREAMLLGPGDVAVTNHPAWGGSHLPDVTLITPVFDRTGGVLLGWVANRAHHAEIGGTRPGSMPPNATTLAEEGVVIAPTYLMQGGEPRIDAVCRILAEAPYPTRALGDNRADLEAALAANHRGSELLSQLAAEHGASEVWNQMERVQDRAERVLRECLRSLGDGDYTATEYLDDGTPITVRIKVEGDAATIDFAGTGPVNPGNLNATPAIAMSAVLYVLRLLVRESLPLNEGLLRPITLRLPVGTLLNPIFDPTDPTKCPAVVGGNTETSQRAVDTLLKALGFVAGSQGTMNNTLWGNSRFGYYETVCGGAGATATAPGASAVHTNMTNTRITDAEITEIRYPVRIVRFERRWGSGGEGMHFGGDGVIRETLFLEALSLSLLTQHRTSGPYGLAGGSAGKPGRQYIVHSDDRIEDLASISGCDAVPGDRLILETPGGGGYGTRS
ncbi:MAG: 5-oxoprolinase, partial [Chthonomonadales bacterium]|nr:5-oxoprolinase [Chthonomonadales bacterium]